MLKTLLAQNNNICSKQHLLKTTFAQNNIFFYQYSLETTQTRQDETRIDKTSQFGKLMDFFHFNTLNQGLTLSSYGAICAC